MDEKKSNDKTIISSALEVIAEMLNQIQESSLCQNNRELMWYIGEALGHIYNAEDELCGIR